LEERTVDLASREEIIFPPSRRAPALARRAVRDFMVGANAPDNIDTAELLASELVTNAVIHGRGNVTMRMEYDGSGLAVTVRDDEPNPPVVPPPDPLALHGRGLHLIEALASAWGIEATCDGPGKGVWFRLA
jgi:anti-sigma regulatory factor (Ser/Thr protein kinase)